MPLGFLALAIDVSCGRGLALALAKGVSFVAGLLLATVDWFSRLPHVSYRIPGPPVWLVVAFFGALFALAAAARSGAHTRRARAHDAQPAAAIDRAGGMGFGRGTAGAHGAVASYPFAPKLARGKFEVNVLDVGQGDSIFVGVSRRPHAC